MCGHQQQGTAMNGWEFKTELLKPVQGGLYQRSRKGCSTTGKEAFAEVQRGNNDSLVQGRDSGEGEKWTAWRGRQKYMILGKWTNFSLPQFFHL